MRLPSIPEPFFRIQLRRAPPDKRLETLESLLTPVFSDFTGNSLDLAM